MQPVWETLNTELHQPAGSVYLCYFYTTAVAQPELPSTRYTALRVFIQELLLTKANGKAACFSSVHQHFATKISP